MLAGAAKAQIVPDSSLARESSAVTLEQISGEQSQIISGGAARGENLFHSFELFNISASQRADFLNPEGITRIFSRVTGELPSDINGTLGVLGGAELFILNPDGINFGPNARLELGGSLVATTANSVQFQDGTEFLATDDLLPVLTVDVPIGLGFVEASTISVRSNGRDIVDDISFDELSSDVGLAVAPVQTLALIGGNVEVEGGILRSAGGRVEIGGVREGIVTLSSENRGLSFDYQSVGEFGDIDFSQLSLVEALSPSQIRIVGRDIILRDGSLVFMRSFDRESPGQIEVDAASSLQIGQSSRPETLVSGMISQNLGSENGADISVDAPQVTVQNGGQVLANAYALGSSGNLTINALDSLQVDGFSSVAEDIPSSITTNALGPGRSGLFTVSAGDIRITSGAQIGAIAGIGIPGNVEITAENITVEGALPTLLKPSFLGIATAGTGGSGQLVVSTDTLQVIDGGAVGTTSIGSADAGDTFIRADDFIEVSGSFPNAINPSSLDSSVTVINPITQLIARVSPPTPLTGNAGNLSIIAPEILIRDGGAVRVQNDGSGDAGDLGITANQLRLESGGTMTAATSGGQGGSIDISANSLALFDDSAISASAAESGRGGNVVINSDAIALLQDSSISANAELGSGGQVIISTDALLESPGSLISATSAVAQDGVVEVRAPDEAPRAESDIEPPAVEVPQVAAACAQGGRQNGEFTVTGRGGLPTAPDEIQQTYSGWRSTPSATDTVQPKHSSQIAEAQGWLSNGDGTIRFTDRTTNLISSAPRRTACVNGPVS
ncbi:MAG: filamentous hemagglutinin N-terminal domain-containing protein [Cyanobacteria bacterium P01_D01_bin.1]